MEQYVPAFTLLDYGLTALALVVLGVVCYLFIKFLSNHMSKTTQVLDDLVQITRGMRDEFFRLTQEIRDMETDRKLQARNDLERRLQEEKR